MKHLTPLLLITGFIVCLLQIWWPAYLLTGDGPCHVYNARIINDLWQHKNADFFGRFYTLTYSPNPNWIAHLILASLMFVTNGVIAEKLLLTLYVIAFACSFYSLLKTLNGNTSLWPVIVFLFIFNQTVAKGFYNFSLSIPFFFLMVSSWLGYLQNKKTLNIVLFILFTQLTFFSHPVPFALGCVTCFGLICSHSLSIPATRRTKELIKYLLAFTASLAPAIWFLVSFMKKEGDAAGIQLHFRAKSLTELMQFNYLVNYTSNEALLASVVAIVLCSLFLFGIFLKIKNKQGIQKYDGFVLSIVVALFIYLLFPDWLMGGGLLRMRSQIFVFLLISCYIASLPISKRILNTAAIILFTCFIGMSITRFATIHNTDKAVQDQLSVGKYIRPYSIVLPLNFDLQGRDKEGKPIADRGNIFCHPTNYLGTEKPLIILDNYEASTTYFPLVWKQDVNPYTHLGKDENIEGKPPYASLAEYREKYGVTIDYIILNYFDPAYLSNDHFKQFYTEIQATYHTIYTSPTGTTSLLEKNR